MAIASAAVAQSADEPELSGYTCCNLHYEGDWISDANWSSMPMIPAGARIRTLSYFGYRIMVEIDGRKMRLGLDYGRKQRMGEWARKMIVTEDPRPRIEAWPAPVRDAIRAGKLAIGMTKEQVIIAVGYPPMHQTPSLDSQQWKYWHTGFGTYLVVWDDAGLLKDVLADPQTRFGVLAGDAPKPVAPQPPAQVPGPGAPAEGSKAAASGLPEGLPLSGTQWVYAFTDRQYPRRSTEVTVRALRVDGDTVEELVSSKTATPAGRRIVDPRGWQFLEHSLGASTVLVEPAPYLLAFGSGAVPADIAPAGYPLGDSALPRWITTVRTHGWEQIAVPAGSYRSLRVEINGRRERAVFTGQVVAGRFRMIVWYAPDVKRFVRLEHKVWSGALSGGQIGDDLVELLSYRPPS